MRMTKHELARRTILLSKELADANEMNDRQYKLLKDWRPIKHAHWVQKWFHREPMWVWSCSECGEGVTFDISGHSIQTKVCHDCGALMDQEVCPGARE